MRIIQEHIAGAMFGSRIFREYFGPEDVAVADIETTGLSPRNARVILGGLVVPDGNGRLALQYFADTPEDEEELLDRYGAMLGQYGTIVTYNGNAFDIPFLKKRMKANGIKTGPLDRIYSLDMYRVLKKYSELPELLPDLKQKTVEKYMGQSQARRDTISGGDSVRLYWQYVKSSGPVRGRLLDTILLHNRDDIVRLSEIMNILSHLDLHEILFNEGFPVTAGGRGAVIDSILVNSRQMSVQGRAFGNPEPYREYADAAEYELDSRGMFSIHIKTEDVSGWKVADLAALDADRPELRETAGYESGYLILRGADKKIQYMEANRLARVMTEKLLDRLTFASQLNLLDNY